MTSFIVQAAFQENSDVVSKKMNKTRKSHRKLLYVE